MCRHRRKAKIARTQSHTHTHTHTCTDTDLHIANSAVSLSGQKCCARCAFEFTFFSRKMWISKEHNNSDVILRARGAVQRITGHSSTREFSLKICIFLICVSHWFCAAKRFLVRSRGQMLFHQIVASVMRKRRFAKSCV